MTSGIVVEGDGSDGVGGRVVEVCAVIVVLGTSEALVVDVAGADVGVATAGWSNDVDVDSAARPVVSVTGWGNSVVAVGIDVGSLVPQLIKMSEMTHPTQSKLPCFRGLVATLHTG